MTVTSRRVRQARRYQGPTGRCPCFFCPLDLCLQVRHRPRSVTEPPDTKESHLEILAYTSGQHRCRDQLHAEQAALGMAVDVCAPPGYSPIMRLPFLEADPPQGQDHPPPISLHTPRKWTDFYQVGIRLVDGPLVPRLVFVFLADNGPRKLT